MKFNINHRQTTHFTFTHGGVLDIVFIDLGEVLGMTGDQRGDGKDNILAGHRDILDMGH